MQCSNPGFAKGDILKKNWIWNLLHSHLDHGEAVEAEDVPGLQLPVGQRIVRAVRVETGLKGACYHKRRDLHGTWNQTQVSMSSAFWPALLAMLAWKYFYLVPFC